MDQKLKERLVGAAVLVLAGVLIIPLLLDGPDHSSPKPVGLELPGPAGKAIKSQRIPLDKEANPRATPSSGTISRAAPPQAEPATESTEVGAPEPQIERQAQPEQQAEPDVAPASVPDAVARSATEAVVNEEPDPVATQPANGPELPTTGFSVQIGAFANKANVAKLLGDLESGGFRTYTMPLERNGRVLDAVRVGPVDTIEEARQLAASLKSEGHAAAVVRNDL